MSENGCQKTRQNGLAGQQLPAVSSSSAGGLHDADLCQHREHIEIVRTALELAILGTDDLTCGHLNRLVGGRDNTGWSVKWTAVNASPHDLQDGGITVGKFVHNCAFRVREGFRPALPSLDDFTGALDATVSCFFIVDSISSQQLLGPAPVPVVVCGD